MPASLQFPLPPIYFSVCLDLRYPGVLIGRYFISVRISTSNIGMKMDRGFGLVWNLGPGGGPECSLRFSPLHSWTLSSTVDLVGGQRLATGSVGSGVDSRLLSVGSSASHTIVENTLRYLRPFQFISVNRNVLSSGPAPAPIFAQGWSISSSVVFDFVWSIV